jgi:hypothetical protein
LIRIPVIFRNFYRTKTPFFMNKISPLLLIIAFYFPSLTTHAQSQDDMKAMMNYSTPGEIHKMMAKSVGSWAGKVSMWMEPGAPVVNSVGEAQTDTILGGRYLQTKNTSNFMGMPFEGISITGYDNAKKVFVNSWIDNMGTGMMYLTGKWDASTNSIDFTGSMVDPVSGKDIPVREVLKFVDDNTQVMEMYATTNGHEFKNMEVKYTRK